MTATFDVRGLVEGFYGPFYTAPERNDLIRFLGRHGFNAYLYGPKDDRYHRLRWRDPYPAKAMRQFADTVTVANESGIRFGYAISPGLNIIYTSTADFDALTARLQAFYDIGVRDFGLWLDDIHADFANDGDRQRYGSFAAAHADLSNRVYAWLQALDPDCALNMCPTDYHGLPPFSDYVSELGAQLHPAIDVLYTGREVCSPTIDVAEVAAFAEAIRRPPLIWDNYPVNDYAMRPEMHIGPIRGRDPLLPTVCKGIAVNPMTEAEASKIALATFGDYFADPDGYNPDASWDRAAREIVGDDYAEALRLFAENSQQSCLGMPDSVRLQALVSSAVRMMKESEAVENPATADLEAYLRALDDARYALLYEMDNLALRNNLLPWLLLLELWLQTAKRAFRVLRARGDGTDYTNHVREMQEGYREALAHHKRVTGHALVPLAELARERAGLAQSDSPANHP